MLNKSARLVWLSNLPEESIRALAQQWQLPDWKNENIGRLRLHLSQIEGCEVPLNTQRNIK